MKILCISDATDTLIYSTIAPDLYKDVDFVISAGDLPLRYYDYIQTMLKKDVWYVYGNHNLEEFGRMMKGAGRDDLAQRYTINKKNSLHVFGGCFVDGKCIYDNRNDLIIMGLGGSMLYNNGDSQYTEKQMQWRINRLIPRLIYNKKRYGRALDILITHAPPREWETERISVIRDLSVSCSSWKNTGRSTCFMDMCISMISMRREFLSIVTLR